MIIFLFSSDFENPSPFNVGNLIKMFQNTKKRTYIRNILDKLSIRIVSTKTSHDENGNSRNQTNKPLNKVFLDPERVFRKRWRRNLWSKNKTNITISRTDTYKKGNEGYNILILTIEMAQKKGGYANSNHYREKNPLYHPSGVFRVKENTPRWFKVAGVRSVRGLAQPINWFQGLDGWLKFQVRGVSKNNAFLYSYVYAIRTSMVPRNSSKKIYKMGEIN